MTKAANLANLASNTNFGILNIVRGGTGLGEFTGSGILVYEGGDALKLFAGYASGELNREELKTAWAAEQLAKERGIDFTFIQADTLDPKFYIEETDLLFIDTWHIYRQLVQELRIHGNKARKYIILHDTTSFGEEDEGHWEEYSKLVGQVGEKRGLWPAVMEFLDENPQWTLLERYTHNNGLTILARR